MLPVVLLLFVAGCSDSAAPSNGEPSTTASTTSMPPLSAQTSPTTVLSAPTPPTTTACKQIDGDDQTVQGFTEVVEQLARVEPLDTSLPEMSLTAEQELQLEVDVYQAASAAFDGGCEDATLAICPDLGLECIVAVRDDEAFELSIDGSLRIVLLDVTAGTVTVLPPRSAADSDG